jgi:hypothetical protein
MYRLPTEQEPCLHTRSTAHVVVQLSCCAPTWDEPCETTCLTTGDEGHLLHWVVARGQGAAHCMTHLHNRTHKHSILSLCQQQENSLRHPRVYSQSVVGINPIFRQRILGR